MAWVITSSPTRLISWSTLSTSTRIEVSPQVDKETIGIVGSTGRSHRGIVEQPPRVVRSSRRDCRRLVEEAIGAIAVALDLDIRALGPDANAVAARDEFEQAAHDFRIGAGGKTQDPGLTRRGRPLCDPDHRMLAEFGNQVVDRPGRFLSGHIENEAGFQLGRPCRTRDFRRRYSNWCLDRRLGSLRTDRQFRQPFHLGRIRRTVAAMRGEQLLEHVAGIEKGVDHVRAQGQFALANAVEQVLQDVGDLGQVGEAEGAGRALDRMRGAKDRVELLGIRVAMSRPSSSASMLSRCSWDSSKKTW
jgi:hypothetical protein